jgi:hypothetical protein
MHGVSSRIYTIGVDRTFLPPGLVEAVPRRWQGYHPANFFPCLIGRKSHQDFRLRLPSRPAAAEAEAALHAPNPTSQCP